jgi:histone H3/H4
MATTKRDRSAASSAVGDRDSKRRDGAEGSLAMTTSEPALVVPGDLRDDVHQEVSRIAASWSADHAPVSILTLSLLTESFLVGCRVFANDLDAFSSHAGRKTITGDDILLCARKTPDLHSSLTDYQTQLKNRKPPPRTALPSTRGGLNKSRQRK